jgi:thioredoxin-related protein
MLKKLFLLLFATGVLMAEIDWAENYRQARQEALEQNKPILAIVVSHTCRWCRKLENRTLQNPKVVDFVNEHFIAVLLYRGEDEYPEKMRATMVPTIFFMAPDDTFIMKPYTGYEEPEDLLYDLRMALKLFRKRQAPR